MNKAIEWFARNPVAANLLMLLIMAAGLMSLTSTKQEVFPEVSQDRISISMLYLGATPEEVEEAVCIRIEEAIMGVDGIKRITSTASEGRGSVSVELIKDSKMDRVINDIKAKIDAIETFPEETENLIVREITNRRQVISVSVSGQMNEKMLRQLSEDTRDEIAAIPGITIVELVAVKPYEISINIPEITLKKYNLTLDAVAQIIKRNSLDLPAGSIKAAGGEILLRTKGQAYTGIEFAKIPIIKTSNGHWVTLEDIAQINDGFAETDQFGRFDGEPTNLINVYRVGNQGAIEVSDLVKKYVKDTQHLLPQGAKLTLWQDQTKNLRDRIDLLIRNGSSGLLLVFITLMLFLRFRLAFWVSVGIPVAFLGAFWLAPYFGMSINLISLFGFIIVLGIVVDDAIVVGENIYRKQEELGNGLLGAIEGAKEVAVPVTFGILTTITAFSPLLAVDSNIGKIMGIIPVVVISCLIFSYLESKLVLPAHLAHIKHRDLAKSTNPWHTFQNKFNQGLNWFINKTYIPVLNKALEWRALTLAIGFFYPSAYFRIGCRWIYQVYLLPFG